MFVDMKMVSHAEKYRIFRLKARILGLFVSIMLVVTSVDLLYLWAIGAWYDPSPTVEYMEVGFLSLLIIAGIASTIKEMKRKPAK